MTITKHTLSQLSSEAFSALVEATAVEIEEHGPADTCAVLEALLPWYAEWDRRGGFVPGADCAALFKAWESDRAAA